MLIDTYSKFSSTGTAQVWCEQQHLSVWVWTNNVCFCDIVRHLMYWKYNISSSNCHSNKYTHTHTQCVCLLLQKLRTPIVNIVRNVYTFAFSAENVNADLSVIMWALLNYSPLTSLPFSVTVSGGNFLSFSSLSKRSNSCSHVLFLSFLIMFMIPLNQGYYTELKRNLNHKKICYFK